jgi:hypothetical protein
MTLITTTPPSTNVCHYSICADQTFLSFIRFLKYIDNNVTSNNFTIKIDSKIYLMILIIYYKY